MNDILKNFISNHKLDDTFINTDTILDSFFSEMDSGLSGSTSSLKMIPTYISPDIPEPRNMSVIVIDAGGTNLPDWFLVFDIYDREEMRFFSTPRRNSLCRRLGLSTVPPIFSGRTDLKKLEALVLQETSRFRSGPLEGIIVRRENSDWLESRAKLVRPDFTQSIVEHWSRRGIEWNRIKNESRRPTTKRTSTSKP
jgi:hypothetical protein